MRPIRSKEKWNELIDERLQCFRLAKIQPLFERAQLTANKPPQDRQRVPDPVHCEQSATFFANLDNPGKAFRIVTATQPIALATPPVVRALQDLYPSECSYCPLDRSIRSETSTELSQSDPFITDQLFEAENIRESLRHIKRGSAGGGLADSPDMFIALFLSQADPTANDFSDANISLFSTFLSHMLKNNLPCEANAFFTSSRLIALHKSVGIELKLRPIAIGSALRLICGHISRVFRPYFAEALAPYQWGIGVPNGLDFVYLATSKLVEKYVSSSEGEMKDNPPSRALVQLDLKNMFNSVSRKKTRQLIRLRFPHFLGLFDLMHKIPAKIWFQLPEGEW
ncbi:MAG: hypothetical protein ACREOZ_04845, partial [Gloeomargaritales cyanobacterium]